MTQKMYIGLGIAAVVAVAIWAMKRRASVAPAQTVSGERGLDAPAPVEDIGSLMTSGHGNPGKESPI